MSKQSPQYDGLSYDRYRPSYPRDVANKLVAITNYDLTQTVLEIGCGTGKGTEILIQEGAKVHALEPNADMGKIAQQKFSSAQFSWEACRFEDYTSNGNKFPLITSAHAFHWVDPEIVYEKSYNLLLDGGALAIYRNNRKHDDEFSQREHQIHVELNGSDPHGSWNENYHEALSECVQEYIQKGGPFFHRPQVYEFEHSISYSTEEYLGLNKTYWSDSPDHKNSQQYLDRVAEVIESMGGKIVYPYTTILYVLFRK